MPRGVRIPSWYLLLVAVLGILSRCQSLRDLERFAERHHRVLTESLGIELRRHPSDSAFRYFFQQVDLPALCAAIRAWTIAQIPGGAEDLEQLVCDGKTLRCSIEPTAGGGSTFIAQVTLYSAALGVAISQACYCTGENHERAVLKQLLGELDLKGVLIQADALEVWATGTRDGKSFQASQLLLTSLRTTPKALLQLVRDRWSIESWHWIRDTQLDEDAHRYRGNGAGAMATLRTAALNLLRLNGFQSIRAGMQAVMHGIEALLAMATRQPQPPHILKL